ncbi:MAG: hypothetical protein IJA32_04720 [Lachnospiraceae bacterium]|nr:hypothetical protein [Lachnospiraceae bacterium]
MKEKSVTIVFCALFFGMFLFSLFPKQKEFSESENRYLQQKPEFSFEKVLDGSFEADYEDYIKDQFPARDGWVGLKNKFEFFLGKQEMNGVYVGKEEYFIENHPAKNYESELAKENMIALSNTVSQYEKTLGEGHVKVMLVPNAVTILKDKLPEYAMPYNQMEYMEEVKEALKAEDVWVPLYDTLMQHKEDGIYYHTDHHWTTLGAYYGYEQWCKESGITPIPLSDMEQTLLTKDFLGTISSKINFSMKADEMYRFEPKGADYTAAYMNRKEENTLYDEEALTVKDKYAYFLKGNNGIVTITNHNMEEGETLLVVKDSYANCFLPMIAAHYKTVYVVDLRYYANLLSESAAEWDIDDLLILYNVNSFATDTYVQRMQY